MRRLYVVKTSLLRKKQEEKNSRYQHQQFLLSKHNHDVTASKYSKNIFLTSFCWGFLWLPKSRTGASCLPSFCAPGLAGQFCAGCNHLRNSQSPSGAKFAECAALSFHPGPRICEIFKRAHDKIKLKTSSAHSMVKLRD